MRFFPTAIFCLTSLSFADAWGYVGHQLIASTATHFLTSDAQSQIESILFGQPLSSIAAWADSIKWQARYKFTSRLHYINGPDDDPPQTCRMHWVAPGDQEVIAAIYNYTSILLRAEEHSWEQSEALRFLVHFVSDAHQPLHLSGRARGGNDFRVSFDGYKTNLHKVWDSLLLDNRMRYIAELDAPERVQGGQIQHISRHMHTTGFASIYENFLVARIHNHTYDREIDRWLRCPSHASKPEFGCPDFWVQDVAALNCIYTWPDAAENEPLPAHYLERIARDSVIDELIVRSAMRLAAVLNAVFRHRTENS